MPLEMVVVVVVVKKNWEKVGHINRHHSNLMVASALLP
jgi:hypothetical protein